MTDITSVDVELLALQEELAKFKSLQPRLAEVRAVAESCVIQCRESAKSLDEAAQRAIATTVEKTAEHYAELTTHNSEQFQELSNTWRAQIATSDQIAQSVILSCNEISKLAGELCEFASILHVIAKITADINLPLSLDNLDCAIKTTYSSINELEARILSIKTDQQQAFTTLQLKIQSEFEKYIASIAADLEHLQDRVDAIPPAYETATNQVLSFEKIQFEGLTKKLASGLETLSAGHGVLQTSIDDIKTQGNRIKQPLVIPTVSAYKHHRYWPRGGGS